MSKETQSQDIPIVGPENQQGPAIKTPNANLDDADSWPLQADRMAIHMPLVDCVRILAGHYGRRTSNTALTAGLPIPPKGITPALLIRAAERADMNTTLADRSLQSLAIAPNLPCILALDHGQAGILWDIQYPDKHPPKKEEGKEIEIHPETVFYVQFPETPDERKALTLHELERLYIGYAFFTRPVARTDDRAGPATIDTGP
jgi:ATP-binding cassette subfamily C protein LapB